MSRLPTSSTQIRHGQKTAKTMSPAPPPPPPNFSPPPPPACSGGVQYMDMAQAQTISKDIEAKRVSGSECDTAEDTKEQTLAEGTYEQMSMVKRELMNKRKVEGTPTPTKQSKRPQVIQMVKKEAVRPNELTPPKGFSPPPPCAKQYQTPTPLPSPSPSPTTLNKQSPEMNRVIVDIWELRKRTKSSEYLKSTGEDSLSGESSDDNEDADSDAYLSEDAMSNVVFENTYKRVKPANTPTELRQFRSVTSLICHEGRALKEKRGSIEKQPSGKDSKQHPIQDSNANAARPVKPPKLSIFSRRKKSSVDEGDTPSMVSNVNKSTNDYVEFVSHNLEDPHKNPSPLATGSSQQKITEPDKKAMTKKETKKKEKEKKEKEKKEKEKKEKERKDKMKHGKSNTAVLYENVKTPSNVTEEATHVYDRVGTMSRGPTRETFVQYSVAEVSDCLTLCGMPDVASVCEQERLDGTYLVCHLTDEALAEKPFSLSHFYIAKLRNIIEGFRPKLD